MEFMPSLREKVFEAWRDGSSHSPLTEETEIKILRLGKGAAVLEMPVNDHLHNLSGTLHGELWGT